MTEEEREASLRRAFDAMRRADERAAPSFEAMRAEVEARAHQPQERRSEQQPQQRPNRLWAIVPAVAASAAAAAVMVLVIINPNGTEGANEPPQSAPRAKSSPIEAPGPVLAGAPQHGSHPPAFDLDFLLRVPGTTALAATPDFDSDPAFSMPRVP